MKMNRTLMILGLSFLTLSACKDNEREVETEVEDIEVVEENFQQDLEQMRQDDSLVSQVSARPELSTFAAGLQVWNVEDSLANAQRPIVIFAPTNDAYSNIYQEHGRELLGSTSNRIIPYHIIKSGIGTNGLKQEIQNANGSLRVQTMQGEELVLSMNGGNITLTGGNETTAQVIDSVQSPGGTIYIVDEVLLPNEVDTEVTITAEG